MTLKSFIKGWSGELQGTLAHKVFLDSNVYVPYIKSKVDVLFTSEEMDEVIRIIRTGMVPKSLRTSREHVAGLQARFSSSTTCPKCGGALVLRTTKAGANAGSPFYGCNGFPKCRYVKKVED